MSVYSPEWLELREPADAAARARELPELLRGYLPHADLVIRDLGSGTGSLGRWLANGSGSDSDTDWASLGPRLVMVMA